MLSEFQTNRPHFQGSVGASVFMTNSASVPEKLTVIVTGASAGIGRIICLSLAKKNYRLVLAARSADKLARLEAELTSTGCEGRSRSTRRAVSGSYAQPPAVASIHGSPSK